MSARVVTWVWEESQAEGTELLVLLALADHADDWGVCWPHQDRVATKCRVSVSTVGRAVRACQARGDLLIERTTTGNRYRIPVSEPSVRLTEGRNKPSVKLTDPFGQLDRSLRSNRPIPSVTGDRSHRSLMTDAMKRHRNVNEPKRSDASLEKSKADPARPALAIERLDDLPERHVDFDPAAGLAHLKVLRGGAA